MNIEKIYTYFFPYVKQQIYEVMRVTGERFNILTELDHIPMLIEYKNKKYQVMLGYGIQFPIEFEDEAKSGMIELFQSISGHICELYIKLLYYSVHFDCKLKGTSIHYIDGKFEHRYDSYEKIKAEASQLAENSSIDLEADEQLTELYRKKITEIMPLKFIVRDATDELSS